MLKLSAQLNDESFQGTAEDLAAFVTEKLVALGYGERHQSSERLVRFYAYEGLLSRPEQGPVDKRQKLFGPLQVRQLLLARLLSERGWDLRRIGALLGDNRTPPQLDRLIDELATPTEAEKLFFRTRPTSEAATESVAEPFSVSAKSILPSRRDTSDYSPAFRPSRKATYATVQQIRHLAESDLESPAEALRILIKKEMANDELPPAARHLLTQLLAFHPTSPGDEPKTERWTKLRLTHWCEAHFNIDSRVNPTKEELSEIVDKFSKALYSKYL